MASRRDWPSGLALRLAMLGLAEAAFVWSLSQQGLAAVRIVAGLAVAGAGWMVWVHATHANRETARFLRGIAAGDLAQGFAKGPRGAGLDELGAAFAAAMARLRAERMATEEARRVPLALAEEAPVALLSVDEDRRVTLVNKAARKLFARLPGTRVEDFAAYGAGLVAMLGSREAMARRVVPIRNEGVSQRAMIAATRLTRLGPPVTLLSVQPIQAELSAVELAAQADLVRVLTHEIMNSMTPVVSLAGSAARLIDGIDPALHPDLADARLAVETLARRAGGIMHFVDAYRSFSSTPELAVVRFAGRPWADEIARLHAAAAHGAGVPLAVSVEPEDLVLDADPDLLAQVVLNLLKNGAEAAAEAGGMPAVSLSMGLLPGGRTRITVTDTGPGIDPARAEEVFLPFYTTKRDGTGVGLSLARRIVAAHGGTLALAPSAQGARFDVVI